MTRMFGLGGAAAAIRAAVEDDLGNPIGELFARQSNFDIDNLTLYIPKGPNQNAVLPPNFNQPYTFGGVTYPALFPNVNVSRGQVSQYLIPWDKADFGPRIGIAWNILDKTVIRAAYGVFYGGERPSWARRTQEAIYAAYLGNAGRIAIIDYHTGLGPWGYAEPIMSDAAGSPGYDRGLAWFGANVTTPLDGSSTSAETAGDNLTAAPIVLSTVASTRN